MPNGQSRVTAPYIPDGNPDNTEVSLSTTKIPGDYTFFNPGELGCAFDINGKVYENVIIDSGCTSANTVGVVTANQLLFWKNKAARIVTNDIRQCVVPSDPASWVSGIARKTVTTVGAGGTMVSQLKQGANIPVVAGTAALGPVVADTTANTARVVTVTGTRPVIGIARVADSGGVAYVDVNIPLLS